MDQETCSELTRRLTRWLDAFSADLGRGDVARVIASFTEVCYWRDLLAFTWNLKTLEGRDQIAAMLSKILQDVAPDNWRVAGEPMGTLEEPEGWITFETSLGRGKGLVRLRGGQCWTLLTALDELKGFEEPLRRRRIRGAPLDVSRSNRSWLDTRTQEAEELGRTRQPHVLIVGGGQAGLGLGARLTMLGVSNLIVDKHPHAGDQWRSRYRSLCLHDPVWIDHMPYLPFPDHWPVYTPKDKMGEWLETYAKVMELNTWQSAECVGAAYVAASEEWHVRVVRDGHETVVKPRELVFAIGTSGKPNLPVFRGAESFAGVQLHSSQYRSGKGLDGKRVAVIGSNNSAHDICADLWENCAKPTMIQRSSTMVVRGATIAELLMGTSYSEQAIDAGLSTEKADLLSASLPFRVLTDIHQSMTEQLKSIDADFYRRLEKAGFMLDFGEDGTGVFLKYLRRASGYYIDVGASELIVDGRIALRSRVNVDHIEPDGVVLSDGSKVLADMLVYATGFGSMDQWTNQLLSGGNTQQVGKCWGYGSGTSRDPGPWEGELRNMWKPTVQAGLWFHGGNLQLARHFSSYLALQLKARQEGLPLRVYGAEDVGQKESRFP